jgi:hypothetical protein
VLSGGIFLAESFGLLDVTEVYRTLEYYLRVVARERIDRDRGDRLGPVSTHHAHDTHVLAVHNGVHNLLHKLERLVPLIFQKLLLDFEELENAFALFLGVDQLATVHQNRVWIRVANGFRTPESETANLDAHCVFLYQPHSSRGPTRLAGTGALQAPQTQESNLSRASSCPLHRRVNK